MYLPLLVSYYTHNCNANCCYVSYFIADEVKLDRGRLTLNSFIKLTEMEAEESPGDCNDFWVTLTSMGFNKDLMLNEVMF
jgi:hypothetical protein